MQMDVPQAIKRINATDAGVVIRHGNGPDDCDIYGAREAIVFKHEDVYYLHYDGAGPTGWLACLAMSYDLQQWELLGPVLDLGPSGSNDSAAATSPWVFNDGNRWHMFYLGNTQCLATARPSSPIPLSHPQGNQQQPPRTMAKAI